VDWDGKVDEKLFYSQVKNAQEARRDEQKGERLIVLSGVMMVLNKGNPMALYATDFTMFPSSLAAVTSQDKIPPPLSNPTVGLESSSNPRNVD
jgi:hypothetical protein